MHAGTDDATAAGKWTDADDDVVIVSGMYDRSESFTLGHLVWFT